MTTAQYGLTAFMQRVVAENLAQPLPQDCISIFFHLSVVVIVVVIDYIVERSQREASLLSKRYKFTDVMDFDQPYINCIYRLKADYLPKCVIEK
jgi:hypothetical protein